MARNWILEVEPGGSPVVKVGIKDPNTGNVVALASSGGSVAELEKEIASLKSELDQILAEASKKIGELSTGQGGAGQTAPAQVWKKMEAFGTEAEMIEYFNSLGLSQREQIAEYVFTNVNMFKGRGPVFSEHYDASTHTLE